MIRVILFVSTMFLLVVGYAQAVDAQSTRRPARREGVAAGSIDPVSVRAEYASTLLQARRYREAAAEFRKLLQTQPGNFEWRLNYARALAWGGQHREAEVELRTLAQRAPRNATVEELLRSARANIEPSSREARAWVAERPGYLPYTLALARAYVREGRYRAAVPHFDAALGRQPSAALLGEAAAARARSGDRRGAVDLYRRAVERAPSDPNLRRSYALALAANRDYAAALEQYTHLANDRSDPRWLVERAEIRRRAGDERGAESDLLESVRLRPTTEGYVALGDMYRWSGRFKRARAAYREAAELRPRDPRIAARLALLTREERPGFGYAPALDEQVGVTVRSRTMTDNTGFVYGAGEGRLGFPFGTGVVFGLGVEPRFIYDRSPGGLTADGAPAQRIVGAAVTAGLAHRYHGENVDTRIVGRGGVASHSSGGTVPVLAGAAVVTYQGAWSFAVDATEAPAYTQLTALGVVEDAFVPRPSGSATALVMARTFGLSAAAPLGIADVAARYESMWLNDGNSRLLFQGSVRVPLVPGVSLLYQASSLRFAYRSTLYWDPEEYVTHAAGLELGARSDAGVAFTARILPGVGRSIEGLTVGVPDRNAQLDARYVGQLAATGELSVRRGRWDTVLGAAFGTGRSGGYQRFDGTLSVRYTP